MTACHAIKTCMTFTGVSSTVTTCSIIYNGAALVAFFMPCMFLHSQTSMTQRPSWHNRAWACPGSCMSRLSSWLTGKPNWHSDTIQNMHSEIAGSVEPDPLCFNARGSCNQTCCQDERMQLCHQLADLGHQVADLGRAQMKPLMTRHDIVRNYSVRAQP
jgi:hypothetical protein